MFTVLVRRFVLVTLNALFLGVAALGQSAPLRSDSFSTGLRPLGVETSESVPIVNHLRGIWAVIANSGDNSVTVFDIEPAFIDPPLGFTTIPHEYASMRFSKVIRGIPSPYAVADCGNGKLLVTSPAANLVSVIDPTAGKVLGTISVGPKPYSASCGLEFPPLGLPVGLISNYGDSSLAVLDISSLTVTKTIQNVPGSRGFRGIALNGINAWVTGTDANVLTQIDLNAGQVVRSIPVPGPIAVAWRDPGSPITLLVASMASNSIFALDRSTLQISVIANISTPQDIVSGNLGIFASTGPGNSVAQAGGTQVIADILGAAGMAAAGSPPIGFGSPDPTFPPEVVPPFVLVTSPDANKVYLIQTQPVLPSGLPVSNGASFATATLAPGMLASGFGSTGVNQNFNAASVPLPKTLGGIILNVGGALRFDITSGWNYSSTGGLPASLLFVGPKQINFQIPPGIAPGSAVPAQLTKPDGTTLLTTLNIAAMAPGIFTVLQNGQWQAAVLNQDNTQNFGTNPAKLGSVIQIYATGGGETTPSLLPGEAAAASGNPLVLTNAQPTVTIGGQTATVQFSGMAPGYVGLWQINAQIPQTVTPGNAVPLVVTSGGFTSNTVTIAVQ